MLCFVYAMPFSISADHSLHIRKPRAVTEGGSPLLSPYFQHGPHSCTLLSILLLFERLKNSDTLRKLFTFSFFSPRFIIEATLQLN